MGTTAVAAAALSTQLRCRYESLRSLTKLPWLLRDFESSRRLWIQCQCQREPEYGWQPLLEGLTLLALLAQTDRHVWIRELNAIWTADRDNEWINEELRPRIESQNAAAFTFGISFVIQETNQLDVLLEYLRYDGANSFLRKDATWSKSAMQIPIRIQVECLCGDSDDAAHTLYRVIGLVRRQLEPSSDNHDRVRIRITEVCYATNISVKLNALGLEYLAQIDELGVLVRDLLDLDIADSIQIAQNVTSSLQSLLHVGGYSGSDSQGVKTVTLSDKTAQYFWPAILSAIQHSTCVETVNIFMYQDPAEAQMDSELAFEQRSHVWGTIAYALFSRHSSHKIQNLEMLLERFNDDDFESVDNVLRSNEPLRVRYGSFHRGFEGEERMVTALRFYLKEPALGDSDDEEQDENHVVFETRIPLEVRVVGRFDVRGNAWLTVILPGRGPAWVRRQDVITSSLHDKVFPVPGFPRITITSMSDDSMDNVASLFELIGHDTTELSVGEYSDHNVIDDWCVQVLTACPKLEKLYLNDTCFQDIRTLVDCIVEEGHQFRCLTLNLVLTTPIDAARDFCQRLSDPHHPLTAPLQELSLVLAIEDTEATVLMDPVKVMLDRNRTLRKISIVFRLADHVPSLKPLIREALSSHTEQVVVIPLGKLDLRSKLAFLSVVDGESDPRWSINCRSRMDCGVVAMIFQFAAPSCTRRLDLDVRFPGWTEDPIPY